jgi:hypothetical protein
MEGKEHAMLRHSYRECDYAFGQAMFKLRTSIGLTQTGLLGVFRRAVGEWEGGSNSPKSPICNTFLSCGCSHSIVSGIASLFFFVRLL